MADKPLGAPSDFFRPFGRLPGRRRVLILLLAAFTAAGVVLTLLYPPGGVQRKRPPAAPDVAACAPGQTEACVGSISQVIGAPAPAAALSPAPAASR